MAKRPSSGRFCFYTEAREELLAMACRLFAPALIACSVHRSILPILDEIEGDMHTHSVSQPLVLAVAGVSFGWGSAGKIDSVLRALRGLSGVPPRVVGLSTDLGRPLLAGSGIDRWYEVKGTDTARIVEIVRAEGIRAGLCVLDGPTAKSLEAAGVPAVFLDSLPFLWVRNTATRHGSRDGRGQLLPHQRRHRGHGGLPLRRLLVRRLPRPRADRDRVARRPVP
ncbi:hypothetical protein [Streptomyces aquilus]|uniref:hypothetical protein n=1 Tax=Streptomyces aquilus TaxID=2548456 RepID=UPI0036C9DF3C